MVAFESILFASLSRNSFSPSLVMVSSPSSAFGATPIASDGLQPPGDINNLIP
jgi:hypothetical protein